MLKCITRPLACSRQLLPLVTSRWLSGAPDTPGTSISAHNYDERTPVEIKLRKVAKKLEIKFDDGKCFSLPAELLRVKSPSADVERVDAKGVSRLVSGRRHIGILSVDAVGSYAVRIVFDDLHRAGIFTWGYLYDLGLNKYSHAKKYLRELQARGLSRDPRAARKPTQGASTAAAGRSQPSNQGHPAPHHHDHQPHSGHSDHAGHSRHGCDGHHGGHGGCNHG